MNRNMRRLLAAGVSGLAISAVPAMADTTNGQTQTAFGTDIVDQTINISHIGDDRVYGVYSTAPNDETNALVNSVFNGQFVQFGFADEGSTGTL